MDKATLEKKLLELFAAYSVTDIEANNGEYIKKAMGVGKYPQLTINKDYNDYYETFKELRGKLDDAISDEIDSIEQSKECLRLLKHIISNDRLPENWKLLHKLIMKGIYTKWSSEEQTYFDTGWAMLTKWTDYFLSYTNRDLIDTNNDFEALIRNILGDTEFNNNKERINLVAKVIVKYLKSNNLTAFFDQDSMKCGDMIEDEVFKHCESTFAFVQLVEKAIFQTQDDNKKNWCFHEYEIFDKWISQNLLKSHTYFYFIFTGKDTDIFPAKFPGYYKDWKKKMVDSLHIKELSSLSKSHVVEKINEIAKKIIDTKERILEDYIEN